jgi:hypothetical protein
LKRIIVTPAGRKKFLEISSKYLIHYQHEFDEWHLWCNTDVPEDLAYINELSNNNSFIKIVPPPTREEIDRTCNCDRFWHEGSQLVYACTIPYFLAVDSSDENAVYLRLDDDIIFIKKDSIKNIFEYRESNTENFLVYGNIVNNGAISHIHQNIGALSKEFGEVVFDCMDKLGLYSGPFALFSHYNFFDKYNADLLDTYNFGLYELKDYTRVCIQAISWRGEDYKKFDGAIPKGVHEEVYQSCIRPEIENKKNVIFGDSLFCHYAAEVHAGYINSTSILSMYKELSDKYFL